MLTVRQFCYLVWGLLLLGVAGCAGKPYTVEPVTGFDVHRYTGTWYEIMRLDNRFERNLTNVTATYELQANGSLSVTNRGFNRKTCKWETTSGHATFQHGADVGSLSVRFFWPITGGYHIFALDKERYNWAVVSGPNRRYLWILGREPVMPEPLRAHLVSEARENGFSVRKLVEVDQGPPVCQ